MASFLSLMIMVLANTLTIPANSQDRNIFILAGQSNMAGQGGVVKNKWDHVVPPECQPNPAILRLSAGLKWEEARKPLHADIDLNVTDGVGPGLAFANSLLSKRSSDGGGVLVGLVPCAVSGTKISQWAQGSQFYNQLVRRAKAALQGGGTVQAMLWYQGESDTVTESDANAYKERLEKFISDLRADLQLPTLLVIQVALASGRSYTEIVRQAQLGTDLPNVRCVDAKGLALERDNLHLTSLAQVRLGELLAEAFLKSVEAES